MTQSMSTTRGWLAEMQLTVDLRLRPVNQIQIEVVEAKSV